MPDKLPSMPVFVADLLGSTRASLLSLEERGAYDWLMFHEWNAPGGIPFDLDSLCRLLGATSGERKSVEKVMGLFFENRDGKLWNEKLERIREEVLRVSRSRSRAASLAAAARWDGHASGNASRNASVVRDGMHPIPNPILNPNPEEESLPKKEGMSTDDPLTLARIDWGTHFQTWNTLAAEHGLTAIKALKADRRKKLKARLGEHGPKFWELVAAQLATRGRWAREKGFPKFDQAVNARTCQKLLEGNYGENNKEAGRPDWV